jgi:hypothetical protein
MSKAVESSIEISRRPEDVFAYMLEPMYYPEWDDSAISADRGDPSSPPRLGSKTKVLHRMGPFKVPTTEELIELAPPRQFTNRGVSGPLAGVARCTVEPLNDGRRSRVTIALEIEASGFAKLFVPLALRRAGSVLPEQLKKAKEILEGGRGVGIGDGRQEPSASA